MNDDIAMDFVNELFEESDRGCVLMIHSLLEEGTEKILRGHFKRSSNVTGKECDELLTSRMAPLGSHAVRCNLAFALGLIDRETWGALFCFRKMRNDAAHRTKRLRLSELDWSKLASGVFPFVGVIAEAMEKHSSLSPFRSRFIELGLAMLIRLKVAEKHPDLKPLERLTKEAEIWNPIFEQRIAIMDKSIADKKRQSSP